MVPTQVSVVICLKRPGAHSHPGEPSVQFEDAAIDAYRAVSESTERVFKGGSHSFVLPTPSATDFPPFFSEAPGELQKAKSARLSPILCSQRNRSTLR